MILSKTYTAADLPVTSIDSAKFTEQVDTAELKKRIKAVIAVEGPITEWLLSKRVLNSFRIYKAGSTIRPFMQEILAGMKLKTTTDETGRVYWPARQDPADWHLIRLPGKYEETCRDVINVPTAEIANAILYVLQDNEMDEAELLHTAAALLGYSRMGTNVREGMARGLQYLLHNKWVRRKDKNIVLRKKV